LTVIVVVAFFPKCLLGSLAIFMMVHNTEQRVCVKFSFLLGISTHRPLYSPDLAPCDFFLFPHMKGQKKGKRFADVREVKKKTLEVLNNINTEKISRNVFSSGKNVDTSVSS
jgi:hypothetical protein